MPWRDDAARPFLASQPWSGVVSQFALPGGSARRVGAVEHAGLSFEDALRAAAKARGAELRGTETAAAAAAGAVPLDDDRRRFIAAELDFADATSRANAADVAIRSIARAAFQKIAKALHVDKQRGAADADDTDVSVARAKHARDVLYDPLKRRKYLVLCDDAKWKADERARETRAADAAARRAARGGDGEVDAAGMEREERQFSDFRARAEDERRRELENQERMKQRSASLYESKRATERREATGRGVRAEERGGKVAAQFAKNAEKLRAVKAARDVEEDGSGRAARAHRLHGNKPNPCRTPVLELVGDAFHRVADGGTKKFKGARALLHQRGRARGRAGRVRSGSLSRRWRRRRRRRRLRARRAVPRGAERADVRGRAGVARGRGTSRGASRDPRARGERRGRRRVVDAVGDHARERRWRRRRQRRRRRRRRRAPGRSRGRPRADRARVRGRDRSTRAAGERPRGVREQHHE